MEHALLQQMLYAVGAAKGLKTIVEQSAIGILFPHLGEGGREELLEQVAQCIEGACVRIAGPPLYVRGAELMYHVSSTGSAKGAPLVVQLMEAVRRKESYLGTKIAAAVPEVEGREELADYAEAAYGDRLIWDRSEYCAVYFLVDLENGIGRGICTVGLDMHPLVLAEETASMFPWCQAMEASIISVVPGVVGMLELCGVRAPFLFLVCQKCGGGISRRQTPPGYMLVCSNCAVDTPSTVIDIWRRCSGAPHSFAVDYSGMRGYLDDMPPVPVKVLAATGWERKGLFARPPKDALCQHYMEWARKNMTYEPMDSPSMREIDI